MNLIQAGIPPKLPSFPAWAYSSWVAKGDVDNRELFIKSPCLSHYLGASFYPLYPLFQWHPQSNEILLNLSMKCWNSSVCLLFTILRPFGTRESIRRKVDHGGQIVLWYTQGWRVIIVVVQVRVVKIYLGELKAPSGKRKNRMKLSLSPKLIVFWVSTPREC